MPRELRALPWIVAALTLAAIALDMINGRFWASDFRVYWSAARGLLDGGPVYGVAFGEDTGFYKYAPVVALAFVPAAWLPFPVAAAAHVLLSGLLLIPILLGLERTLMRHVHGLHPPRILLRAVVALLCVAVLLARELHLGNINLWLVLGFVLATEAMQDGDDGRAGALLGLVVLVKPYLLLVLVPPVAMRRWKLLAVAAATGLAGLALPFLVLGVSAAWHLHMEWVGAMRAHAGYLSSPDTFRSLLQQAMPGGLPAWSGIAAAALVAAALFIAGRKARTTSAAFGTGGGILPMFTALALVPHLVITDQEHFLFSLPLLCCTLGWLARDTRAWRIAAFTGAMVLFATRSSDLWGPAMEAWLSGRGALGLGNLLLVALAWTVRAGRGTH